MNVDGRLEESIGAGRSARNFPSANRSGVFFAFNR